MERYLNETLNLKIAFSQAPILHYWLFVLSNAAHQHEDAVPGLDCQSFLVYQKAYQKKRKILKCMVTCRVHAQIAEKACAAGEIEGRNYEPPYESANGLCFYGAILNQFRIWTFVPDVDKKRMSCRRNLEWGLRWMFEDRCESNKRNVQYVEFWCSLTPKTLA